MTGFDRPRRPWRDAREFRRLIRTAVPGQIGRRDQFAVLTPVPADAVVFLGDSITEAGIWNEWFPEVRTLNRGIGGETAEQIGQRITTAVRSPRAVFILAGTNDLHSGARLRVVARRVTGIADAVLAEAPGTPVYLQSILPRAAGYAREIVRVNALLQTYAAAHPTVEYVDLWPVFADERRAIRSHLTFDRLHLTGAGYAAWVEVIRPLVLRHA